MTVTSPEPANTRAVEPKVKAATVGSYLAGVLGLALVNAFTGNDNELIVAVLPDWVEAFVLPIIPALVAFLASWNASHQWRVNPRASGGATGSTRVG